MALVSYLRIFLVVNLHKPLFNHQKSIDFEDYCCLNLQTKLSNKKRPAKYWDFYAQQHLEEITSTLLQSLWSYIISLFIFIVNCMIFSSQAHMLPLICWFQSSLRGYRFSIPFFMKRPSNCEYWEDLASLLMSPSKSLSILEISL